MTFEITAAVIVIWIGIALFIFRLDRKVKKIEEELREK
ncbi:MAG: CcmD family protein [Leptospirales bacterium]|nr:CcmD family protein [Leptospirales bacterium]